MVLSIIAFYITCMVVAYGVMFAHFQHEFESIAQENYYIDMAFAIGVSIFGPLSLIMAFILSGFARSGLKFT